MHIRAETVADHLPIRSVNGAAFPTPDEADLVDRLRGTVAPFLSLVAEDDGEVVGHILCTPVRAEDHPEAFLMGLAPMAVSPARQREGIGSALVKAALDACRQRGAAGLVVLGHTDYYPRFGFKPAHMYGLRCVYDVPPEVFMAMPLQPGGLDGVAGLVHYAF
ncbi:MAG: N-acetyltransferase [Bacteroidota bacterium]